MADAVFCYTRVGRPPRFVEPELVKQLRSSGLSFRQIARKTGLGYGTVRRAYHGIQTTAKVAGMGVLGAHEARYGF